MKTHRVQNPDPNKKGYNQRVNQSGQDTELHNTGEVLSD